MARPRRPSLERPDGASLAASEVAVTPLQEVSPVVTQNQAPEVPRSEVPEVPTVVTDPGQPADAPSFVSPAPLPDAASAGEGQPWLPPLSHSAEGAL